MFRAEIEFGSKLTEDPSAKLPLGCAQKRCHVVELCAAALGQAGEVLSLLVWGAVKS